jgi:hypothetical protein
MPCIREPVSSKQVRSLHRNLLSANLLQIRHLQIRGRLYPQSSNQPAYTLVPTANTGASHFPMVECLLSDLRIQPFIHDGIVVVREGNARHMFRVFCKNHHHLPVNDSVTGNQAWRGDILVMRVSQKGRNLVVNMRGNDGALSDFLVQQ